MNSRRIAPAVVLDVLAVLVFVALGRRSHQESSAIAGVLSTAAPFLLAMAVAWVAARVWRAPLAWRSAVVVWIVTVAGGMALRSVVFDRGVAVSFVIVATAVLGVALLGWRTAARLVGARRGAPAVTGP